MNLRYRIITAAMAIACAAAPAAAQSHGGSNSSYSRYGLGLPADPSQGFNRAMGGVAQGLRSRSRINMQNPASYSAMDSLTFLFDVGMGLQRTRMSQGNTATSVNNTAFEYVSAAFRLGRNLGMSVGFRPFTDIGYSFTQERDVTIDPYSLQSVTQQVSYDGNGGLHQAYIGAGWRPFKGLSVGANAGIIWGSISNQAVQTFTENGTSNTSNYSSLSTYYSADILTWKGDIGLQYQHLLNQTNLLTVGATVGIGHTVGSDATILRTSLRGDTIKNVATNAYQLPMTYSFGIAWEHAQKLTLAADVTLGQWGSCTTPQLNGEGTNSRYEAATGEYSNNFRISAGLEYVPDRFNHAFLSRVNYRLGAFYTSPNQRINGHDGPHEFGITAGVALPITNAITNRSFNNVYAPSYVNIGLQWTRRDADFSNAITENVFRINIGLTFNERWFMKWQFR